MSFWDWFIPSSPASDSVFIVRAYPPITQMPTTGDIVRANLRSTESWWWRGSIDVQITDMPSGSVQGIVTGTSAPEAFPIGAKLGFSVDEVQLIEQA